MRKYAEMKTIPPPMLCKTERISSLSSDGTSFDVTSVANMAGSVYDPNNQESSSGANTQLSSANIASSGNSFGGGGGGQGGGDGPEPTSGILLLVGAGILGLRRKRA